MKKSIIKKGKKGAAQMALIANIVKSGLLFFAFYLGLLFILFIMFVLANLSGWVEFFQTHATELGSLCACIFMLYFIIYFYYYYEDKQFLFKSKNIVCLFTCITLAVVLSLVASTFVQNIYVRPAAFLAVIGAFMFGRRQAIVLNLVFSMLIFVIDNYTMGLTPALPDERLMYFSLMRGFVCGTLAVFLACGVKTRLGLLMTGVVLAIPTVIIALLFDFTNITSQIVWMDIMASVGWSTLGCLVTAILALAFLPLFEVLFNHLTVFRLRELTRTDASLLMRLKTEAPGTFNHSLIVAQLSESCALAIGENAELCRAAAYYHDVGKLKQPDCFTENQTDYNIHNELTPELSADIIRSHAKDGYDLLIAEHLPQLFADVALQHHGTLPIKYFYAKAMKISGGDANIKDYSYFGPTPQTKIAAIVMIADASEAAVRALSVYTPENIEKVVRGVIEERMDLDQFADCDITLRDLSVIKQTIVDTLSGVHHHRVKYPSIRFNRKKEAVNDNIKFGE